MYSDNINNAYLISGHVQPIQKIDIEKIIEKNKLIKYCSMTYGMTSYYLNPEKTKIYKVEYPKADNIREINAAEIDKLMRDKRYYTFDYTGNINIPPPPPPPLPYNGFY